MIAYDFFTTKKLEEALDYLDRLEKVKVLAGGTDLLVDMHKKSPRLLPFSYLLDISNLEVLKFIRLTDHYVEIGSLITHSQLIKEPLLNHNFPLLVEAARTIGSTQIRNRGTIGGNLLNTSPAADLLPPLIALRAELVLTSKRSERVVPLAEFLTAPYKTKIEANELLTKIKIPLLGDHYYTDFQKIGRRKALSISRLSIALVVKIDPGGIFQDVRVVPGSATPYPQSLSKVEKAIDGKSINKIDLEEIGRIISEEMISITGVRWSTPYKKPTMAILLKRSLEKVIKDKGVKGK